jgi:hypothetical protein
MNDIIKLEEQYGCAEWRKHQIFLLDCKLRRNGLSKGEDPAITKEEQRSESDQSPNVRSIDGKVFAAQVVRYNRPCSLTCPYGWGSQRT